MSSKLRNIPIHLNGGFHDMVALVAAGSNSVEDVTNYITYNTHPIFQANSEVIVSEPYKYSYDELDAVTNQVITQAHGILSLSELTGVSGVLSDLKAHYVHTERVLSDSAAMKDYFESVEKALQYEIDKNEGFQPGTIHELLLLKFVFLTRYGEATGKEEELIKSFKLVNSTFIDSGFYADSKFLCEKLFKFIVAYCEQYCPDTKGEEYRKLFAQIAKAAYEADLGCQGEVMESAFMIMPGFAGAAKSRRGIPVGTANLKPEMVSLVIRNPKSGDVAMVVADESWDVDNLRAFIRNFKAEQGKTMTECELCVIGGTESFMHDSDKENPSRDKFVATLDRVFQAAIAEQVGITHSHLCRRYEPKAFCINPSQDPDDVFKPNMVPYKISNCPELITTIAKLYDGYASKRSNVAFIQAHENKLIPFLVDLGAAQCLSGHSKGKAPLDLIKHIQANTGANSSETMVLYAGFEQYAEQHKQLHDYILVRLKEKRREYNNADEGAGLGEIDIECPFPLMTCSGREMAKMGFDNSIIKAEIKKFVRSQGQNPNVHTVHGDMFVANLVKGDRVEYFNLIFSVYAQHMLDVEQEQIKKGGR